MKDDYSYDFFHGNWKDFFQAAEEYVDFKIKSPTTHEILLEGLKVFQKLPCTQSVGLFLISPHNLGLEFKLSLPPDTQKDYIKIADITIDSGVVGKVLSTGNICEYELKEEFSGLNHVLLIPLKTSRSVIGIVYILMTNPEKEINQILYRFKTLYAGMFASDIQSLNTLRDLETTKAILEQKVYARTIDLNQSQRELRTVIDSVLTGILVVDLKTNKIIQANPIAQDLIGLDQAQLLNQDISNFLQEKPEFIQDFEKLSKESALFETELRDSKGMLVPIIRKTTQIKSGLKEIIIESFVNISERKVYENALKDSNEILELKVKERTEDLELLVKKLKLEIAEREKVEQELKRLFLQEKELGELKMRFVNMVSHEFRTPLTVIKSSSQLIERYYERFTQLEIKRQVEKILHSVDKLADLLDNTTFLGRSEAHKIELQLQEVNLTNFFENLIKDIKQTYDTAHKFEVKIESEIDYIISDPKLLWHILNNLLSNAVKYSPPSSSIQIRAKKKNSSVQFEVQDFGIGIPEEEQNKIFEMFYRASNVGIKPGTGLGLSVVNESIKKLNGHIQVKSSNNDTTFLVLLPLIEAEN